MGEKQMSIVNEILTGVLTGFGTAIGTYLAFRYAISHYESLEKKGTSPKSSFKFPYKIVLTKGEAPEKKPEQIVTEEIQQRNENKEQVNTGGINENGRL
jgi:hypothetical protein